MNFEPPAQGAPRGIARNEYLRSSFPSNTRGIEDTGINVGKDNVLERAANFNNLPKSEKANILKELGLDSGNKDSGVKDVAGGSVSVQGSAQAINTSTTSTPSTGGSPY